MPPQQPQMPQGMEPMSQDPTSIRPSVPEFEQPQLPPEEVEAQILESMNDLSEEDMKMVAMHLTPEFAQVMRLFFGDQFGNVFDKLADPTKILVPLDREYVLGKEGTESGTPIETPAINQQSEATPPTEVNPASEDSLA